MERVFQGIKMETKQQFLEEINKVKGSKRDYLNKLFQYVSEAVIRAAVHKNVKKMSLLFEQESHAILSISS